MAVCGFCHQQITGTDYRSYKSKKYHLPCFDELKKVADHKDKALAASSSHKEKELDSLCAYVCQLFQLDKMPKSLIRQAENIQREDGLSFAQIEKGLWWFHEINGNTPDVNFPNLGIAPYAYEECEDFFLKIESANQHNNEMKLKDEVVIVKPFTGNTQLHALSNLSEL